GGGADAVGGQLRERQGDGAADAAASARDDRDLVGHAKTIQQCHAPVRRPRRPPESSVRGIAQRSRGRWFGTSAPVIALISSIACRRGGPAPARRGPPLSAPRARA